MRGGRTSETTVCMRKASKVASLGCPCCFINNPLLSSGKNSKTVLIRQLWNIEIALKPNTLSDEGRSTEPSYENVSVEVVAFIQKKALVSSARAFYFQTYGKNWYLLSTFVWSSGQWIHISFYHFARGRVCPYLESVPYDILAALVKEGWRPVAQAVGAVSE